MNISGQVAQKRDQNKAIRILILGIITTILALTTQYTKIDPEYSAPLLVISASFISVATILLGLSLVTKYSAELATFSPVIRLPNSIARKSFNSLEEPIVLWEQNTIFRNVVLIATEKRVLQIYKGDLGARNWASLLASLPEETKAGENSIRGKLSKLTISYGLFCTAVHLFFQFSPALSHVDAFNILAQGAYNPELANQGEFFRTLSYSTLHANNFHLGMNLIALLFIAQIIGTRFSSATLTTVIIVAAYLSGVTGNALQNFDIVIGASGAVMGLFGYLFAAQNNKDKRLHPFHRFARQKPLYFVLAMEIALSLKFSSYAASIHIAGFISGYVLYLLAAYAKKNANSSAWKTSAQLLTIGGGLLLLCNWFFHTYQTFQDPRPLAQNSLRSNDDFLELTASAALPDLNNIRRAEIIEIKRKSIENAKTESVFAWPAARADYWLGNNEEALKPLRKLTSEYSDSEQLRNLWLAVERDSAKARQLPPPLQTLPAGPGAAYVISANYEQLARLKLAAKPAPIEQALTSKPQKTWHLITITAEPEKANSGTYGAWLIPTTQFRTAANVNLAESATD